MSINMTGEPHVHNYGMYGCWCGAHPCKWFMYDLNHACKNEAVKGESFCMDHLKQLSPEDDY